MPWLRYFPDYAVPQRLRDLIARGLLKDASAPEDPAPSFTAKLLKRGWLRVWVEHPDFARRRAGPFRFRVEVTDDLAGYGRLLIEDDALSAVWPTLHTTLKTLGVQSRFRLLGDDAIPDVGCCSVDFPVNHG